MDEPKDLSVKSEPRSPSYLHDVPAHHMSQTYNGDFTHGPTAVPMFMASALTKPSSFDSLSHPSSTFASSTSDIQALVEQRANYMYTLFPDAGHVTGSEMHNVIQNEVNSNGPRAHEQQESVASQKANPILFNKKHIDRSSLPKKFKCAMCAYRTRYKSDLNRHVRKHAVSNFNCDICNMPFKTAGNVEFHKRKEHPNEALTKKVKSKFYCSYCPYGTLYSSDLTRHTHKHGVASYHCSTCNKPFMTSGSLVHHKRTEHNVDDLMIVMGYNGEESVCPNESMQNKPTTTIVDEQERSEVIDITHDNVDAMHDTKEETVRITDSVDNRGLQDETKGTGTTNSPNEKLSNEIKDNANSGNPSVDIPQYCCPVCDKGFGRKMVLEFHMRNTHKMEKVGDKPGNEIWINLNEQEVEDQVDLGTAIDFEKRTHEVESNHTLKDNMKYQCELCAYGTMYKSTYDRHVRKHGFACHICDICNMPFITVGHMLKHQRDNHSGDTSINSNTLKYTEGKVQTADQTKLRNQLIKTHCNENIQLPPCKSKNTVSRQVSSGMLYNQASAHDLHKSSETASSLSASNSQVKNERVTSTPPSSGRYAKLISDFDEFASRPFACALCFFRTNDLQELVKHAENHLTGCNTRPIAETARFSTSVFQPMQNQNQVSLFQSEAASMQNQKSMSLNQGLSPTDSAFSQQRQIVHFTNRCEPQRHQKDPELYPVCSTSRVDNSAHYRKCFPSTVFSENIKTQGRFSRLLSKIDPMTPTFSVHYRKDKTNKLKPYLCLMCKKRFKHLPLLKQHFRQFHSAEISAKVSICNSCGKSFRDPTALLLHYDLEHSS
ncbi:hypothetical protein ACJMK2_019384 [Sinanodonta woodiana]|uniref:C2H2-type domain-containing protein n=1 Tax=Sinanodonta woodiana TaxID=1069815 RepID=A0ABD3UJB0_SINWO